MNMKAMYTCFSGVLKWGHVSRISLWIRKSYSSDQLRLHTCIHTCIHTYIRMYIRTHTHTYTCMTCIHVFCCCRHSHVHMHAYMHTYMYTHMHTYMYTYIHNVRTYVHMYMHTYTGMVMIIYMLNDNRKIK